MLYNVVLVSATHQQESVIEDSFFFFLRSTARQQPVLRSRSSLEAESPVIVMGTVLRMTFDMQITNLTLFKTYDFLF